MLPFQSSFACDRSVALAICATIKLYLIANVAFDCPASQEQEANEPTEQTKFISEFVVTVRGPLKVESPVQSAIEQTCKKQNHPVALEGHQRRPPFKINCAKHAGGLLVKLSPLHMQQKNRQA